MKFVYLITVLYQSLSHSLLYNSLTNPLNHLLIYSHIQSLTYILARRLTKLHFHL